MDQAENDNNDQGTNSESDSENKTDEDQGNNASEDDSSDTTENTSQDEMDEAEYEIINKSNQKTHHDTNDGRFVEDLENIDELHSIAKEQNAEVEGHRRTRRR